MSGSGSMMVDDEGAGVGTPLMTSYVTKGGVGGGKGGDERVLIPYLDSPSYNVLLQTGLLTARFRRPDLDSLDMLKPNTTKNRNCLECCAWGLFPIVGWICFGMCNTTLNVKRGHVQKLENSKGEYVLAGPGLHLIRGYFWKKVGRQLKLQDVVEHGNRTVVTVDQGFVGLAWDLGQPVLLPPGVHEWISDTLRFSKYISLSDPVIEIGPYTLVTVDDGYAAITINNGKLNILSGGNVHFLDHRNWKFQKFITLKIQSDNLERIKATTADNVVVSVTSTVVWRIVDIQTAALMGIKTLYMEEGSDSHVTDISILRTDVLMQAEASLASFIGSVNYSDSFHVAAAAQAAAATSVGYPADSKPGTSDNPIFDHSTMKSAVQHANDVTRLYGVQIMSINIISANPLDNKLTIALSSGAVASADALQAETAARAKSKAQKIEADTLAENKLKAANANAEAMRIEAKGALDAAKMLESSGVAVDLAKMDKVGAVLGEKSKFFFGPDPGYFAKIRLYDK